SAPVVQDGFPTTAAVGQTYRHQVVATDLQGDPMGYVLLEGPEGMVLDPRTGLLEWLPDDSADPLSTVVLRVYDDQGGYSEVSWTIAIAEGVNRAPDLVP